MKRQMNGVWFSPREPQRQRFERCSTHRRQSVLPPKTDRRVRDHYDLPAYGKAITYACRWVWPALEDLSGEELRAWRRDYHWSPKQLRDNAATRLRNQFGPDVARIVAGHSSADITQVYANADLRRAIASMEQAGECARSVPKLPARLDGLS